MKERWERALDRRSFVFLADGSKRFSLVFLQYAVRMVEKGWG